MAEWLRRWTDNLMGAVRVGSIPITGDFFCSYFFFNDDDGEVTRSGAGERKTRASNCQNELSEFRC